MARAGTSTQGTFVRIPLPDGTFGYGRVLGDPYMAFYAYRTPEPSSDLDEIGSKPVLFRQCVKLSDDGRWPGIGHRELAGEVAEPSVFFTQPVGDFKSCTIFDSAGMAHPATPEACVGLERASVWEPRHIEERLLDTFLGRPNEDEVRARVRFSDD